MVVLLVQFLYLFVCSAFILHDTDDFPTYRIPKFHRLHHRSYARGIQPIGMAMTLSQVSYSELNEITKILIISLFCTQVRFWKQRPSPQPQMISLLLLATRPLLFKIWRPSFTQRTPPSDKAVNTKLVIIVKLVINTLSILLQCNRCHHRRHNNRTVP